MPESLKGDYCITIDFKKDSPNPERIFQAMTALIQSFQKLDNALIDSIDSRIEPIIILEDIETGSLRTWLATIIRNIPDEAIQKMDWKLIVGSYLKKAKYIILNLLEGQTTITDVIVIDEIQGKLLEAAEETDIKSFPNYHPVQTKKLLNSIDDINKSLQYLDKDDKAYYNTDKEQATFNLLLQISPDDLEDLMTSETLENSVQMNLKVNKPDYLGDSMWVFKHDQRTIAAKIIDTEWLQLFQQRKVDVRPGDSLKCQVHIIVKYGKDMTVLKTVYEITKVIQTINFDEKGIQLTT